MTLEDLLRVTKTPGFDRHLPPPCSNRSWGWQGSLSAAVVLLPVAKTPVFAASLNDWY